MAEIHRPRNPQLTSSKNTERVSSDSEKSRFTMSQGRLKELQANILKLALPGAFIAALIYKIAEAAAK